MLRLNILFLKRKYIGLIRNQVFHEDKKLNSKYSLFYNEYVFYK